MLVVHAGSALTSIDINTRVLGQAVETLKPGFTLENMWNAL